MHGNQLREVYNAYKMYALSRKYRKTNLHQPSPLQFFCPKLSPQYILLH